MTRFESRSDDLHEPKREVLARIRATIPSPEFGARPLTPSSRRLRARRRSCPIEETRSAQPAGAGEDEEFEVFYDDDEGCPPKPSSTPRMRTTRRPSSPCRGTRPRRSRNSTWRRWSTSPSSSCLFFLVTAQVVLFKTLEVPRPNEDKPPEAAAQGRSKSVDELEKDYILVEVDAAGAIKVDRQPSRRQPGRSWSKSSGPREGRPLLEERCSSPPTSPPNTKTPYSSSTSPTRSTCGSPSPNRRGRSERFIT